MVGATPARAGGSGSAVRAGSVRSADRADDQALRVGRIERRGIDGRGEARRVALGPQVDDQLAARQLAVEGVRQLGDVLVAHLVQHGEVGVAADRRQRHLQVRDLDAFGVQRAGDPRRDVAHERVAVERRAPASLTVAVDPAEERLALAIRRVVDVEVAVGGGLVARQDVEPGSHALSGPRRHLEDPRLRILAGQRVAQGRDARRLDRVDLVDQR